jgi:cobalt-zinc-cadmium efflux system outer membrane protein
MQELIRARTLLSNTTPVLRRLGFMILVCLMTAASLQAQTAPPTQLTLEAALARAAEANPTIVAARQRRAVDLAGVDVARERPNPEAHVEFERETPKEAYGMAVPVETGGKRGRRIAVSQATVRVGESELAQIVVEVLNAVRRAYFARAIADARLALFGELRDIATRARDAAQARFDAGSAPRLEVVQADLALAQVENDAVSARATADVARARLNTLLALPLDAAPQLVTPFDTGTVPSAADAIARAQGASTELAVFDRRIEEQRAKTALARAMQVPDVTPEGMLTRNAAPEFDVGWRAAVVVAVPVFTRHRAGVRLEEATLVLITSERAAALTRITGDAAANAALAAAQRDQYQRYRDQILPRATEVERMAEDSYRLGQTGVAAFLQALQSARDARLRALQAALDFQNALADLERAIGAPLQ